MAEAQTIEHDTGTEVAATAAPAPSTSALTPMEMISSAVSNGAEIALVEKLMDLQERWEAREGRKAFDVAIADAKGEIPVIGKNRTVDFTSAKGRTHYRHEDLAGIAQVVDPILAVHGLSYRFRTSQDGGMVTVTCVLSHRDGYSEDTTLSAGRDETGNKNNHQAIASAVTYLQRYTLKAALGLAASDDDDGASATQTQNVEVITEEQAMQLREAMEAAEVTHEMFQTVERVQSVASLPGDRFDKAMQNLADRLAKLKAGE